MVLAVSIADCCIALLIFFFLPCTVFFFSSRRRHTIWPRDWSSDVCSSDLRWYASALGIEPADALHAGVMDWPHRDPFDRMLAAQALRRGMPLISRDEVFDDLPGLRRLW